MRTSEQNPAVDGDEVRRLLAILQAQAAPIRWYALRRMNLNIVMRSLVFLQRNPSRANYVRRWGPIVGALLGLALAYLWLWRARQQAHTWGGVFTDPLVLVGTATALLLGVLFGYWRARYEWKGQEEKLHWAREYVKGVQEVAPSTERHG